MSNDLEVTNVRFSAGTPSMMSQGLYGWASFDIDKSIRVDGVAVRSTLDGRWALSFPARRDGAGRQHAFVRPLSDDVRRDIEQQVFHALGSFEQIRRETP